MSLRSMLLLSFAVALAHPGQTVVCGQQEPLDGLQPVEQLVADRGPLSTSLRWVQYGLNQPYNFNDLYQLPVGTNEYVRRNSGLWAVFPRSIYHRTEQGVARSVPAGTVYYIGGPAEVLPQIAANQRAYVSPDRNPVDRAVESRIEACLIDTRVPVNSVMAEISMGRGPIPAIVDSPEPAPEPLAIARSGWSRSGSNLSFARDESYRRDCFIRALRLPEGTAQGKEVSVASQSADHAARGSSGPDSK